MASTPPHLLHFFVLIVFLVTQKAAADESSDTAESLPINPSVGVILNDSSRIGKEERVAMEMAVEDFYAHTNQSLVLHIRDAQTDHPAQAAFVAADLINKQQVQAILGPQTWEETSQVAETCNQAHVPILSFTDSTPKWATEKWPFLLQASSDQHAQTKAIAAIVQSWEWHQITVIYEDTDKDSSSRGIIPDLSYALREEGAEIIKFVALPPLPSSSMAEELEGLKNGTCRVFVVHLSAPLGVSFFEKAKEMKMMEKDYVWITTDTFTSLVHSFNASTMSSMQGIVGVKRFFPENGDHYKSFYRRFRRRFGLEYPEEDCNEPGIFAVQAYDAVWAVALAMKECSNGGGQRLLDKILEINFDGLTGKVGFGDRKLAPAEVFQIVNVMRKSYREVGFWSEKLGFSETIDEEDSDSSSYETSMNEWQVFWPGRPRYTPKGWTAAINGKPLRIGVPTGSIFKKYVRVEKNDKLRENYSFSGFAIDLFKATVAELRYDLPYNFFPFNGTYDAIVEQVHLKKFDAVVGDVAIVASRYKHAEFTHPYSEPGLVMIVPARSKVCNKAWLFLKPFTKAMWLLIVAINVYSGFVVWMIERNHCPDELKGSVMNQIGTLLWLAFSTPFSLHGEKLHSNLSRMTMAVWLYLALIITQTYTANLTSMLTVQRLEPTITHVEALQSSNAMVGYCRGSFVSRYLVDVLQFAPKNIKNYSSPEDYARALRSKEIAAAFLEVPLAKLFIARYCNQFIVVGPTYKVGGFGFVFPRGSPLLPTITEALLKVSETGKLREVEKSMLASEKCVEIESDDENSSLSPNSLWALFVITGTISTIALLIYVVRCYWKLNYHFMLEFKTIWTMMFAVMKHWRNQKARLSRRVSDADDAGISPNFPNTSDSLNRV